MAEKGDNLGPLPDEFVRTPRDKGEPEVPDFPNPFGIHGPLTKRKQVLKDGVKRDDHGLV